MRALSVARAICMELKQEKDRKSLNVKVLVKNGYITDYPTLFNFSDPWACSSCRLKEYGQPLVNTVKTLKAEVASLKKQVNSKSCPSQVQYATTTSRAATTISQALSYLLQRLFNFSDVDRNTLSGSSLPSKSFRDFVLQNNLSQLVHSPTHLKANILDFVLTNSDEFISNIEAIPPHHSLSFDHYILE